MELHGHPDPKATTKEIPNQLQQELLARLCYHKLQQKNCGHDGSEVAHDHRMGRDCHNGLQFVLYVAVPSTYAGIIYLHWAFQTMLPAVIA